MIVITQGYVGSSEETPGAFMLQGLRSRRMVSAGYHLGVAGLVAVQGLLSGLLTTQGYRG